VDLLGGELCREPFGCVFVVVEQHVLGLLLTAKPNPNKIRASENPHRAQHQQIGNPSAN